MSNNLNNNNEQQNIIIKTKLSEYKHIAVSEISKICAICEKELTSFCKSHTIPYSFLKNIDMQEKLLSIHSILDNDWTKQDKGAKEAGVFYSICDKCDHELFSKYENKDNYKKAPSSEMLQEIVLKILAKEIYEHRITIKTISCILRDFKVYSYEEILFAEQETLQATVKELSSFTKKWPEFRIIYFKKLSYTVPIAYQDQIAVISDFKGEIINNTFINSDKIQLIYECILPLENESILLLFTISRNKRYSRFIHQFNKLSDTDKQKTLLYLMFCYSQNFFISKKIASIIKKDSFVKSLTSKSNIYIQEDSKPIPRLQAQIKSNKEMMKRFSLEDAFQIQNYLSKDFAM